MIIKRKKDIKEEKPVHKPLAKPVEVEEEEFDFDEIDFSQRQERRRGDRRRGYRRIDDRNLVSRAQEEAMSIKENSIKEGYFEGIELAKNDLALFKSELKKFMGLKDEVVKEISRDILDISVKIAEKIIKKEIESDHTILLDSIQDVLSNIAKNEARVTIKVSPDELEYAKENIDEILSNSNLDAKILVKQDKTLTQGSVIVETSNGIVDATLETQLEIIKEAFKVI